MALLLPRITGMMPRAAVIALLVAFCSCAGEPPSLRVRSVQHRGWWEIRYPDGTVTANELHIPVNQRVAVDATLDGLGVLWFDDGHLPRIGHATVTFNDSAMIYAWRMREPRTSGLMIIADQRFDDWLGHEKRAAAKTNSLGEAVFLTARCTLCHSVRGVATGELPEGPDLTHVASRRTLAAGVLPNRPGHLSGWIVDPETIKPGSGMPINNIDSTELQSLLAYLRTLK